MQEAVWSVLTSRKVVLGALAAIILGVGGLWLLDPDAFPFLGASSQAETPTASAGDDDSHSSAGEHIARLQQALDANRKFLQRLQSELDDPDSEFKRAEKRFQIVDAQMQKGRQEIQQLKDAGKTQEALTRAASLKDVQASWQRNRERFDLAVKERKTLQNSIAALKQRIKEGQLALDHLSGATAPEEPALAAPAASKATNAPSVASKGAENPSATTTKANQSAPQASKTSKSPSLPSVPGSPLSVLSSAASTKPETPESGRASREVTRAREEAKLKDEAAKKAENKAQSIGEHLQTLTQNIALAENLMVNARKRADHEQQTKTAYETELKAKTAANAPQAERDGLSKQIEAAQRRFQQALADLHAATDHLHEMEKERHALQSVQIKALREAETKKHDAEAAEARIAWLQNPFRPRNMVKWLFHHGPHLLLIVVGMLIFSRFSRVLSRRLVVILSRGDAGKRGSHKDRENRAETLAGVFTSALSLFVLGGGTLMILDEVDIPIVPLMGGAAVLGLAVAFGAQNLIKDYFSGFMVLLEDQYGINDVVRIGSISGLVEHISLRTTVLRDSEGIVHFIPHGTIATVSNMTHGWSRALFNIGIGYKEDVDRVMELLLDMGREMRQDDVFGPLILDNLEMLGVDNLADSSVVILFLIKTKPCKQWTVKREMLRRIKNKFDALGIEIPFPHQTVYYRFETPPSSEAPLPSLPANVKRAG